MGHSAIAFIIVLGVLVFFHELGHFLAARLCKVGVQVFSLGFGPKIFKKKVGITDYCVCAIPLGGYVKMVGEEPGTTLSPEEISISFTHKTLLQKSMIVAAGPVFNFLLAIFIFYCLFQFSGVYLGKPEIGKVLENSPAQTAGIQPGDIIKQINHKDIESFEEVSLVIKKSQGNPVDILVDRGGDLILLVITPELGTAKNEFEQPEERYMIGISVTGEPFHKTLNPIQAMGYSLEKNWEIVKLTLLSVVKIVSGSVSSDNLGGPIMIAQMAGEQAKAGLKNFVFFIALLSINLGILNLFPIPILDGGHLLFFGIEAVIRKPVNERLRGILMQMGMALLVILMVFVFYNDILRLLSGE